MAKRKANAAFMAPKKLSPELQAVVGKGPMPRSQVVKMLWKYIKKHGLQDTKKKINMFEMNKILSKHLS